MEVECSEAATIVFYSNTLYCRDRVKTGKIVKASYHIKPTDTYVRVEITDDLR